MLWHRRLGYISIDRIKRLVNDGVLSTLDYTDFEICVDCIKGKQTNKSKKNANRSSNILEIIHTDICCPDTDMPGQKYFITFIDDYSRYMYVYLLHNTGRRTPGGSGGGPRTGARAGRRPPRSRRCRSGTSPARSRLAQRPSPSHPLSPSLPLRAPL